MTTATAKTKDIRHNDTPKGHYGEWEIWKYEGIPGLASPDLPYWWARKGDVRLGMSDTKRDLVRTLDAYDSVTDEEREATRATIARALGLA